MDLQVLHGACRSFLSKGHVLLRLKKNVILCKITNWLLSSVNQIVDGITMVVKIKSTVYWNTRVMLNDIILLLLLLLTTTVSEGSVLEQSLQKRSGQKKQL